MKLKYFVGLSLFFLTSSSIAQVVSLTWDVEGITVYDLDSITLEIRLDNLSYFLVNGVTRTSENAVRSAVGSCYFIFTGDIVCEIDVRNETYVTTISENGNGTLKIWNNNQFTIDEGNMFIRE